jgi:GT2 family glycosyltransferase
MERDWLEEMVRWAEQPQIGAVGAKLLYPDGTIQHAGVIMGMQGLCSHVFWDANEHDCGVFGCLDWYRDYLAVTGACMMMRREVFEAVGGFNEAYQLVFSDVEICLRIVAAGYRVVFTPFARLLHYEGRSRAEHIPQHDLALAYEHMRAYVEAGDPYYNPNLSYLYRMPMAAPLGEESRISYMDRMMRFFGVLPAEPETVTTRQSSPQQGN